MLFVGVESVYSVITWLADKAAMTKHEVASLFMAAVPGTFGRTTPTAAATVV